MTAVAIQATFKKDQTQWDGLAPHVEALIKNPHAPVIVVAICEVVAITERPQEGTHQPKIRIKQIELAAEGDAIRATEILNRVYNARTGRTDSQPTLFDDAPYVGTVEHPGDWPGAEGGNAPGDHPTDWANDGEQQPAVQESAGWRDEATGLTSGGLVTDDAPTAASEQPAQVKPRRGRRPKAAPAAQFNPGEQVTFTNSTEQPIDLGGGQTVEPGQTVDMGTVREDDGTSPDVGDKATGGFITAPGAPDLGDDADGDSEVPWPGDVDHPGAADDS